VCPLTPVIVTAAHSPLTIASSVALAAASHNGINASWGTMRTVITASYVRGVVSPRLPVENARKMSPMLFSPRPPTRATSTVARWARRRHCPGSRGASVASMLHAHTLPVEVGEEPVPGLGDDGGGSTPGLAGHRSADRRSAPRRRR